MGDDEAYVYDRKPLWIAAKEWCAAVIELLVATGKVYIDTKDFHGRVSLWMAAERTCKAVVE